MPSVIVRRPPTVARVAAPTLLGGDPAVGRVVGQVAAAVGHLSDQQVPSRIVVKDLVVGVNRINHGLGRRARLATVAPTVADATFAWAFTTDNDTQAIVTVVGVAQPGAAVEIK